MTHTLRGVKSLNGLWDFSFLGPVDLASFKVGQERTSEKMLVPAAFDALPAYAGRRGTALYRTHFTLPPGRKAFLKFGAVSMWTQIYVDGKFLFEHACGYAPFSVEIPSESFADRELTVLVDNRFDFDRVPMHLNYFDFYQYGGIIRDVALHVLPAEQVWIDAVQVVPTANYQSGKCEVAVFFGGQVPEHFELKFSIDGEPLSAHKVQATQGFVRTQLQVPNPRVWSPEAPNLHSLRVIFCDNTGRELDDAIVRFGLRQIEARQGALWLNGEKLKLRGYNRHEWHPNTGPCTSVVQMMVDLQILKDLGCNFIRGSHYPQDQRFLDLCDELGFLVWEENLGWGQRENTFASEKFRKDHLDSLRSMVRESWNHPSVIIWGFLNEAWSNMDYVRPIFEESVSTLRSMDPSRLVSFATMCVFDDKQYDLVDLISINIYPGWYGAEKSEDPLSLIRPHMEKCFNHLDAVGWQDKPVIISEIGAEALYGWHDSHNDFFTEEYQAAYIKEACLSALTHPRCSGIALWHFSDVRTYGGGLSLGRPRTFNNKGTVDEYRRPKAAYKVVRQIFRGDLS
jgi:beta-glucuronidase